MKRTIAVLAAACLCAAVSAPAFAREEKNLYDRFEGKTVKFHVAEPADTTKDKKIDAAGLRREIEGALLARKSVKFEKAASEADAELRIATTVNLYEWSDHDPVDMLMGIGSAAYDAATNENYARMEGAVTATDGSGRKLWHEDTLVATVTDNTMTEADGPARINKDFAKSFLKEALSKNRASKRR